MTMILGLNWVDIGIIVVISLFALEAYGGKLLVEVLDFLSFLSALILSFRYYNFLGNFFEKQFNFPHGLSLVLGFMLTWFLAEAIFYLIARMFLKKLPNIKFPGEHFLAMIPGILKALIFISLLLVLVATFPVSPKIKHAVENSKFGPIFLKNAYQLEQPIKQVFGGVTNDTLTFLTIKPKTNEKVNLGFITSNYTADNASEQAMINLVNTERAKVGLKALKFDSKLRDLARFHSEDMFKRGYFSHYSPEGDSAADRASSFGISYQIIGENLAYAPTLDLAHQGLMNSPGHRANILSEDYGKIGIGVMDGGIYGKMFTQEFSD